MYVVGQITSTVLFLVPVFVTFGIYFGVDHERILSCGFHCGVANPDDPFNTNPLPKFIDTLYCQKSYAISPPPGGYIFNPNQWGDPDNTGALCINFTGAGLDGALDNAPSWAATWQYPQGPETLPVHAFPNADLKSDHLPIQLSRMSGLTIDVSWSYHPGNLYPLSMTTDFEALAANDVNANVCVDMFMAATQADSLIPQRSEYEIMVWLGQFGAFVFPLGYLNGSQATREINGVTFSLYYGDNSFGQHTFTWLADRNVTEFNGDVSPLLTDLALAADVAPGANDYLGYVAFGSEALWSTANTTFYNEKLVMEILT